MSSFYFSQKQDIIIQEKQSFAFVQTLLHVTIAKIAYLRKLFPKKGFALKDPAVIEQDANRAFDESRGLDSSVDSSLKAKAGRPVRKFAVLAEGEVPGADIVLDWLKIILEGLLHHSLDGFRISIYADKSQPQNILESYTFSFAYHDGQFGTHKQLIGVGLSNLDKNAVTVGTFRSNYDSFVRQLHQYHQSLPDLPRKRYLMCHLFHPDGAASSPPPSGFSTCENPEIFFPRDHLWHREGQDFGAADFGFYRVSLKLSYTTWTVDEAGQDSHEVYPILDNLDYTDPFPNRFDLECDWVRARPSPVRLPEPVTEIGHHLLAGGDLNLRGRNSSCQISAAGGTILIGRKRLRDDQPTTSPRAQSDSRSEAPIATQVLDEHFAPMSFHTAELLPGKLLSMKAKKDFISVSRKGPSIADKHITRCECGFDKEEGAMVQCDCCDLWQHNHCYGFVLQNPWDHHVCYQCLLETSEKGRLDEMQQLAAFRRALWLLYERKPKSREAFMDILASDLKTTGKHIDRLKREGFLPESRGGRMLKPVETAEQTAIRDTTYYDPLVAVAHCYEKSMTKEPLFQSQNAQRKRTRIEQ